MSDNDFEALPGDILYRKKIPAIHLGIYLGNDKVFHNNPENGEHISSVSEFADGNKVHVFSVPEKLRHIVLERVNQVMADPDSYSLFFNNCEHTVSNVVYEDKRSIQLRILSVLSLITVGYLALKKK